MKLREYLHTAEREAILRELDNNYHQVCATARALGVTQATLHRLCTKHNIDIEKRRWRRVAACLDVLAGF